MLEEEDFGLGFCKEKLAKCQLDIGNWNLVSPRFLRDVAFLCEEFVLFFNRSIYLSQYVMFYE